MARYLRNTLTGDITTILADDDQAYLTLLAQRQGGEPNRPLYFQVEVTDPTVTPHSGGGGGGGGSDLPIADPTGIAIDTTTYDNTISGVGKLTTLMFPGDTGALAIALTGDAFPRWLFASDAADGLFMGDGTFDPYYTGSYGSLEWDGTYGLRSQTSFYVASDLHVAGKAVFNGLGSTTATLFCWHGNPTGHVTADETGDLCIDTLTPGLWQWNGSAWNQLGGGGSSFPTSTAGGSPGGSVSGAQGDSYVDSGNGALYFNDDGTVNGWIAVGGAWDNNVPGFGVQRPGAGVAVLQIRAGGNNGKVILSDQDAIGGTDNKLEWLTGGGDGSQNVALQLGSSGQFTWLWNADGSTVLPGDLQFEAIIGRLVAESGGVVRVTDVDSVAGIHNQWQWVSNGTDGQQRVELVLGSAAQFAWQWNADGSTEFPAGFAGWGTTAPVSQPATPVTLADVIAVLQAYGMTA